MLFKIIRHRKLLPYCLEALWDLMACKYLVSFKPFSSYAKQYGYAHSETFYENMQFASKDINAIRNVLRVVPKLLPWKSKCLDQAMTAQRMLKRRRLQSTLYFGVVHDQDQKNLKNLKNLKKIKNKKLAAHAWLRSGDRWVVGYQPNINYTIVGTYACYH